MYVCMYLSRMQLLVGYFELSSQLYIYIIYYIRYNLYEYICAYFTVYMVMCDGIMQSYYCKPFRNKLHVGTPPLTQSTCSLSLSLYTYIYFIYIIYSAITIKLNPALVFIFITLHLILYIHIIYI